MSPDPGASMRVGWVAQGLGRTARRLSMLLMGMACAYLPLAHGSERAGDANAARELQKYATAAQAAQRKLLALCEAASGQEQFNLYWTYNQSTGTWLQVEFLRALLERAVAATSPSDERTLRATLRDQALFTLWELDQNLAHPGRDSAKSARSKRQRLAGILYSLLRDVRRTVQRLSVDEQSLQ